MGYRNKNLSVTLPEADWENVRDLANMWGETLSTAGMRIIQRGVEELEKEMGSSTPVRVKIHRLHDKVKQRATLKQELKDAYQMIQSEDSSEREELTKELQQLADLAGINLT